MLIDRRRAFDAAAIDAMFLRDLHFNAALQNAHAAISKIPATVDELGPLGGHGVNKNELIAAVATSVGLSKAESAKAIEATLESIARALKRGSDVRLVGFGTFSVTRRRASEGRNPRTGEKMKIPPSTQVKFKAGKGLKDLMG